MSRGYSSYSSSYSFSFSSSPSSSSSSSPKSVTSWTVMIFANLEPIFLHI